MGLEVNGLYKHFGEVKAVDGLSLSMNEPGIFGLIGTNGAGKTTTIRCILGILPSDKGQALWDGETITRETLAFGYMPEERGIYMKVKVIDQLVYFGMLRGMSKANAIASAEKYLKRLDIEEHRDKTAEKLSKGNQQKVQLITTLIHDPTLLFLDEPFSGLDPVNVVLLQELLYELVDQKKYILMSSHQMNTVEEYCKDIIILHKGKTLLQGNLREIKAGYGQTNLFVSASQDIMPFADRNGLKVIEAKANGTEFRIKSGEMAEAFLRELVGSGIFPTSYYIKEPSLGEIFLEKVGAAE